MREVFLTTEMQEELERSVVPAIKEAKTIADLYRAHSLMLNVLAMDQYEKH